MKLTHETNLFIAPTFIDQHSETLLKKIKCTYDACTLLVYKTYDVGGYLVGEVNKIKEIDFGGGICWKTELKNNTR